MSIRVEGLHRWKKHHGFLKKQMGERKASSSVGRVQAASSIPIISLFLTNGITIFLDEITSAFLHMQEAVG